MVDPGQDLLDAGWRTPAALQAEFRRKLMLGLSSPKTYLCLGDAELLLHIVTADRQLVTLDPRQSFGKLLGRRGSGQGAAVVSHSRPVPLGSLVGVP